MSDGSVRRAKKRCCVPGCGNTEGRFFRFPNPKKSPDLLKAWLLAIHSSKLFEIPLDKLFKSSLLCARHFGVNDFQYGTRRGLKWNVVPKHYLPVRNETVQASSDSEQASTSRRVSRMEEFSPEVNPPAIQPVCEPPKKIRKLDINEDEPISEQSSENFTYDFYHDHSYCVRSATQPSSIEENPENKSICSTPVKAQKWRTCVLKEVRLTRQKFLTPKAKHLYKKVISSSRKISRLSEKVASFQTRMEAAEKFASSAKFENLMNYVNGPTYRFIMSQVRSQHQKPKARRFTLDEKIFALTLFKASGKGYRLLCKLFALPSRRTLTNLLNRIPFTPGICNNMFESLRKPVSKMKKIDRFALLVFDEMSIASLIHYNSIEDLIAGVHDEGGNQRKPEPADHANVFMLKGIFRQWKQPVCYTFSNGPAKSSTLKKLIVEIIRKASEIGLMVIAIVCDQGSANQSAINQLISETDEYCQREDIENRFQGFLVDENEVVPLYDTPHLFKGLRNNLLSKDLHFSINNKNYVGKWDHIEQFYLLDCEDEHRICSKLTDHHIMRGRINKMKVSCCTQVFSYQVGTIMKKIISWKAQVNLDAEAEGTAELILFLDKLFDSLNSSRKTGPPGKPLKAGVTANSQHIAYWYEAMKVLESMKYYCGKTKKFMVVPSVTNLITTLKGFIYLCTKMIKQFKNKFLVLRVFQQDALEIFFGCIRNYAGRETSPSASHFTSCFKSLVVNNFMSSHSPSSNCEEDESEGALANLRGFLCGEIEGVRCFDSNLEEPSLPQIVTLCKKRKIARCTITYIAGFIAKKLFKKISCTNCRSNLIKRYSDSYTDFIEARQYKSSKLIRPGSYFYFIISQCLSRLFYLIPHLCHHVQISRLLKGVLEKQLNFGLVDCVEHSDTSQILLQTVIRCSIFFWCKRINLISKGKDEKFARFLRRSPDKNLVDPVKLLAFKKYQSKIKRAKAFNTQ